MFNYVLIGVLILYAIIVIFAGIEKFLEMMNGDKEGLEE